MTISQCFGHEVPQLFQKVYFAFWSHNREYIVMVDQKMKS